MCEALVEIEGDRLFRDVERELAAGAVIILPAGIFGFEQVVSEGLDGVADLERVGLRVGIAEEGLKKLDFGGRQLGFRIVRKCQDAFDLAVVGAAVEFDCDRRDAGGSERGEQSRLVGGVELFGKKRVCFRSAVAFGGTS